MPHLRHFQGFLHDFRVQIGLGRVAEGLEELDCDAVFV
jgi:hypothetical protein